MGLGETPALRLCNSGNDLGISGFAGTPIGHGAKVVAAAADGHRRTLREVYLEKFLTAAVGLAALTGLCLAAGFGFAFAGAITLFRCHGVLSYSFCFQLNRPIPVAGWPPHCGSTDKSSRGPLCRTLLCRGQQGP